LCAALDGTFRLMAEVMYGAGLRLNEMLMLTQVRQSGKIWA
jgi:site-specific recombinase XerC